MQTIRMSDVTLRQASCARTFELSFKEKLELVKLLDRLCLSVIETGSLGDTKSDFLLIKSIASAVQNSIVAVPVNLDGGNIERVWKALQEAQYPRLQVIAPVSPVQMEYLSGLKPAAVLETVSRTIAACRALCESVEFVADDATRSDSEFLTQILTAAVNAGANVVTLCDAAGAMFPDEFEAFFARLRDDVPALQSVDLGVSCAND